MDTDNSPKEEKILFAVQDVFQIVNAIFFILECADNPTAS